jgi:hypothetical protein
MAVTTGESRTMAQTLNYFIAGYAVILGLLGAYCLYLWLLGRKLKKTRAILQNEPQESHVEDKITG